jgi:hypothetical protein
MTNSEIKDAILDIAFKCNSNVSSVTISKALKIEHDTIYSLCLEMAKDGNVQLLSRDWIDDKDLRATIEIKQAGKHFYKTSSYVQQEEKANLEVLHLKLSVDDLVGKVSDYQDNKWKSNWSFWISIGTAIIALIALLVSIVK